MILLLQKKSMGQRQLSKRKEVNNMKLSREDLLEIETLVDPSTNTIITSDVTWEDGVGEIHHGFNMKAHMPSNEFEEAMDSGNPGDYILGHYPADGTLAKWRLDRLSVDEALCLVNDPASDFFIPGFSIPLARD